MSEEAKKRMIDAKLGQIPWNKGKEMPEIRGEKNANWKGDEIGYAGLHDWIESVFGKPDKCENCEKEGLTGHQIHWHSKEHKYLRNVFEWERLCAKCHKQKSKLLNSFSK